MDWSITTQENGGTILGSGTASGHYVLDKFLSTNQYGYNIDLISVGGLNVHLDYEYDLLAQSAERDCSQRRSGLLG